MSTNQDNVLLEPNQMVCPSCKNENIEYIGCLRNGSNFAGQILANPIQGGQLYRCRNCHLGFKNPILNTTEYTTLYDNMLTCQWSSNARRSDWNLIRNRLEQTSKKNIRVLDYGCNTGELLTSLPNCYQKFGLEVNKAAAQIAAKAGVTVYQNIQEIPKLERFDIIILCDVIEHVEDPALLLMLLSELLNPEGEILVTTGDFENWVWKRFGANWWYCSYPEHIRFISARWAKHFCMYKNIKSETITQFNYAKLGRIEFAGSLISMSLYGIFPAAYQALGELIMKLMGKSGDVPVKGVGICKDHIFLSFKVSGHE